MVSTNEAGFNLRETLPLPRKYPVQAEVATRPNPDKVGAEGPHRYACAGQGRRKPGVGSDLEQRNSLVPMFTGD